VNLNLPKASEDKPDPQLNLEWKEESKDESRKIRYQLYFLLFLVLCWVGVLMGIALLLPSVAQVPS